MTEVSYLGLLIVKSIQVIDNESLFLSTMHGIFYFNENLEENITILEGKLPNLNPI